MKVSIVIREHRARVEREKGGFVLAQFDVDLGQLRPGHKLTRGAVHGLLGELNGPFVFSFLTEKVALDVKKSKRLGRIANGLRKDLDRLDLFVCPIMSEGSG